MTNLEKIRAMSEDEWIEYLSQNTCSKCPIEHFCDSERGVDCETCQDVVKKWLNSEVTE